MSTPKHKNVTLSLPEPVLRRFKVFAAKHNQSMSSLMTRAINQLMQQEPERVAAARSFMEGVRNAPDRGTGGKITWTRDELYER